VASFTGGPIPLASVPVSEKTSQGTQFSQVNVGLNQFLGNSISKQSGLNLTSGQNFKQSQLTSLISPQSSNQMKGATKSTFGSIGSFSSILPKLPQFSKGFGGSGLGNLGGGLLGGGGGLGGAISSAAGKIWPGGGGRGPSNYGGFMHNLGPNGPDVVFSLVPANNGPQTQELQTAMNNPTTATTLPTNNFTNQVPSTASPTFKDVSDTKFDVMTKNSPQFTGAFL
jgi:hypothetical protein